MSTENTPIIDPFTVYHHSPETAHPEYDIDLARKIHDNRKSVLDYDDYRFNALNKLRDDHG
jgi:hypothetical protein